MIRSSLFFILLISTFFASGQDKLYLFVTADSASQGLKNQSGEIIIPAVHPYLGRWSAGESIPDSIIDFYGLPKDVTFQYDSIRPAYTANTTFNREGKVLYHAFFFDNGADYIQEGARRFVDIQSGKMGLIHPYGNVLIPAQYDFLSSLNQGYVMAYNGVKRKTEAGGEHWSIVPDETKRYERVVLNRQGKAVAGTSKRAAKDDIQLYGDSLYYPAVYTVYHEEERNLLERLAKDKDVKELFRTDAPALKLAIIERPTKGANHYVVACIGNFGFDYLLVTPTGELYQTDYYQPKQKLATYLQHLREGSR
ncbi:hypothetical protein PQ465_05375 [Sphingobacterium oryzagri]|uniref:WG containing repeat-containing protein n=1 Tax=Sphingobacterium oryzagri TaxID=3025669 RepID=A0ABY7WN13_9SPHI|nr:WG repeat-containing protein [Sphingobacterium sp. KACC 22765]WDF69806.1 hypothetical protein PQ465_05375 [Sphingobacterium sp. KACC 22765]